MKPITVGYGCIIFGAAKFPLMALWLLNGFPAWIAGLEVFVGIAYIVVGTLIVRKYRNDAGSSNG